MSLSPLTGVIEEMMYERHTSRFGTVWSFD
jgi:hypothetical protein